MHSPILAPVVVLVLWTFVMAVWLYATRIPAVNRHGIVYDPAKPNDAFIAQIPPQVRWKTDNYNNLMEQPTLFYAISIVLALNGAGSGGSSVLAWVYVALRIAHSLVHALINRVMIRFGLFAAGSLVLLGMAVLAAISTF